MNSLNETSQGMRTAIAFLGRRNAGKSSLLNALVGYDLAIVSEIPGTTTDPVRKAVEIHPLGPCLVIDTAGLDDQGVLGEKRIAKTKEIISDADIGLIIIGDGQWTAFEQEMLELLQGENKPLIVVFNKTDLPDDTGVAALEGKLVQDNISCVRTCATAAGGIALLLESLQGLEAVSRLNEMTILGELAAPGDLVLMVVPIDLSAPKGRIILPQVQVLRNILDENALALVVKADQLQIALAKLKTAPALVITDSQVVQSVASQIPEHIRLTTFSILFSRFKGDLDSMLSGLKRLDELQDGDTVLIAEACTHHALSDDIGRVKIPNWLRQYTGKDLQFEVAAGPSFQKDLTTYKLVIQCGGCTISRQAYKNRIAAADQQGVPITNYGLAISCMQGVLPRVIQPFKEKLGEKA